MDPQQLLSRLKALTSSLTAGQVASLAVAFILVVGIVAGSAFWLNKPSYALLFSDMDADSAGEVVARLKTLKVQYQLDEGGRGVRVPASRVDELRIDLSAQGMPASGRVGFEIFDRTAFGATEFLEQVNYRRALEGEIARTIATLSEVASARVHIAMGKDALFGESRPAKASVVLKLRGRNGLPAGTVSGISNLVASSVEGLRPDAVVILDSFGRPLTQPDGSDDPLGAAQLERQQRMEHELSTRVVALLEPVVGSNRVRVNVAVKLNPASHEETEERWDPDTAVVRSKQMTADATVGPSPRTQLQGAGSKANAPTPPLDPKAPAPAPPPASSGPSASRSAETTNYEISRMTRRTVQPSGDLARLSVAVILDDDQVVSKDKDGSTKVKRVPRTHEDLQKIQGLVSAAVGLETMRGDQLTVENVSFEEAPVEEAPPTSALREYAPQIWEGGRILAIVLVSLFALIFVVRPMVQRASQPAGAMQAISAGAPRPAGQTSRQPVRTVAELESEIEAQLDADLVSRVESRRLPVLARRAAALTQAEPENVAKLLRGWMMEPEER